MKKIQFSFLKAAMPWSPLPIRPLFVQVSFADQKRRLVMARPLQGEVSSRGAVTLPGGHNRIWKYLE
jgi:hypothetical protein